jgi:glutathione S-transferase
VKPGLVVDTHAVLWYLTEDPELSASAAAALDAMTIVGGPIYVPDHPRIKQFYDEMFWQPSFQLTFSAAR